MLDTSGLERYKSIIITLSQKQNELILVYDSKNKNSFEAIPNYFK